MPTPATGRRTVVRGWPALLVALPLTLALASPAAADKPRWDVVVSNDSGQPVRFYQTDNESCWEDQTNRIDQGAVGSFIGLPLGSVFATGTHITAQTTVNNSVLCQLSKNFRDFRLHTDESRALSPYEGITMGFHYHLRGEDSEAQLDVLGTPTTWAPSPRAGEGPVCLFTRGAARAPFERHYDYTRDSAQIRLFPPSSGACLGSGGQPPFPPREAAQRRSAVRVPAAMRAAATASQRPVELDAIVDVLDLARRGCRLSQKWQPAATCADGHDDFSGLTTDVSGVKFGNDLTPETFDTYVDEGTHNGTDVPGTASFSHAVTNSNLVTTTTTHGATAGFTIGYASATVEGGPFGSITGSYNFSHSEAVQAGTSTTDTLTWSQPTQPHGTTTIVVKVPKRKGVSTYSGTFTIGKSGVVQRGTSPLFPALDMSTSATQPCIGYLVGDPTVRQSIQNISGVLPSYAGADLPGAGAYLDDAAGFTPTGATATCPGYPGMFRSAIGFSGSGTASLNISDAGRATASTAFHPDERSARARLSEAAAESAGGPTPWVVTSDSPGPHSRGGDAGELITDDSPGTLDTIHGGGGSDIVKGSPRTDRLRGGPGRDILEGGAGGDHLVGGRDGDTLRGGPGADVLRDDNGLNHLDGGPGDDRLVARAGRSVMDGGPGDDSFRVVHGTFALAGGAGDDTYRLGPGARADVIEGRGAGRDRIVSAVGLTVPFGIERVDAVGGRRVRVTAGRGAQTIVAHGTGHAIDAGAGADRVIGDDGGDEITTDAYGRDLITTGAGADRVIVRGILTTPGSGILLADGTGVRQPRPRILARGTTRVTDFAPRDRIVLDAATLGREVKVLKRHMRLVVSPGARPRAAAPTLTFDTRADLLSYDADGTGPSVSRPLLTLAGGTVPTRTTFRVR